jgi:hypothetical protein
MHCSCFAQHHVPLKYPHLLTGYVELIKESTILKRCICIAYTYLAITGSLCLVKFVLESYLHSSFSFLLTKLCLLQIRLHVGTMRFWLMQINGRLYSFRPLVCQARLKLHFHKKLSFLMLSQSMIYSLHSPLLGMAQEAD